MGSSGPWKQPAPPSWDPCSQHVSCSLSNMVLFFPSLPGAAQSTRPEQAWVPKASPSSVRRRCEEGQSHFPGPSCPRQGEAGEMGQQGSEVINQLQMRLSGLWARSRGCRWAPANEQPGQAPTRERGAPQRVARVQPETSMTALSCDTGSSVCLEEPGGWRHPQGSVANGFQTGLESLLPGEPT